MLGYADINFSFYRLEEAKKKRNNIKVIDCLTIIFLFFFIRSVNINRIIKSNRISYIMMQKSKFDLNLSKNIIEQLVTVTE